MFTQDHPAWATQIATMGLCKLDGADKLDLIEGGDQKVVKALKASPWLRVDPATDGLTVPAQGDKAARTYSSRGYATEQVKLFTFVFNAFVFMQVFN